MRTAVLEPLGMKQSTYAWTPEIKSVAALGHDRQGALLERSLAFYEQPQLRDSAKEQSHSGVSHVRADRCGVSTEQTSFPAGSGIAEYGRLASDDDRRLRSVSRARVERYLDALNYYYELLPSDWCQHNSSFL